LCYVFARGGFILGFVVLADKDKAAAPGGEEEKKEAGAGQDARYDGIIAVCAGKLTSIARTGNCPLSLTRSGALLLTSAAAVHTITTQ
jgi:hypothetical protein